MKSIVGAEHFCHVKVSKLMNNEQQPQIIASKVSEENRELLKEIVRQYGKIIDLLTTAMVYIPADKTDE